MKLSRLAFRFLDEKEEFEKLGKILRVLKEDAYAEVAEGLAKVCQMLAEATDKESRGQN